MQDAILQEEEVQSDSSWEVHSIPEGEQSPIPSESEESADEDSGDEVSYTRRRRYLTLP